MTAFTNCSRYQLFRSTSDNQPGSVDPAVRKLRTFASLPEGWSNGEGHPSQAPTISRAEVLVRLARSLQLQTDVFPGINGECAVAAYWEDKTVEAIVAPNKEAYELRVEQGRGFSFRVLVENDAADYSAFRDALLSLLPAWRSSGSSHSDSLIQTAVDSRTLFSNTHLGQTLTAPMVVRESRSSR